MNRVSIEHVTKLKQNGKKEKKLFKDYLEIINFKF